MKSRSRTEIMDLASNMFIIKYFKLLTIQQYYVNNIIYTSSFYLWLIKIKLKIIWKYKTNNFLFI